MTSAPSPTTISTTAAIVEEPVWLSTTIALLCAPKRIATWPASVTATSSPSRSTTIGSDTSVSAGTSISRVEGTSASTRAAKRVLGTRPEMPRSARASSPDTPSMRTPSGVFHVHEVLRTA